MHFFANATEYVAWPTVIVFVFNAVRVARAEEDRVDVWRRYILELAANKLGLLGANITNHLPHYGPVR